MSSVKVEVSSSQVIWKIENFSKLNSHLGYTSDVFSVGAFKWKARIFPKGEGKVYDHLSLCLIPVCSTKPASVEFSFEIVSQSGRKNKRTRGMYKLAVGTSYRMGWHKFMRLSELHDRKKGYIVDDTCVIRVEVICSIMQESTDDYYGSDMKKIETLQTRLGSGCLFYPLNKGGNMSFRRWKHTLLAMLDWIDIQKVKTLLRWFCLF